MPDSDMLRKRHKHLCVPEGNCARNVLLRPCHKIWPFRKVATCRLKILSATKQKKKFTIFKVPHFTQTPNILQNFLCGFLSAWSAQIGETCSSMWPFSSLCCTASWLQMAGVCSGLTEPAVGEVQMLTSPAASVGEPVPHSYKGWGVFGGSGWWVGKATLTQISKMNDLNMSGLWCSWIYANKKNVMHFWLKLN